MKIRHTAEKCSKTSHQTALMSTIGRESLGVRLVSYKELTLINNHQNRSRAPLAQGAARTPSRLPTWLTAGTGARMVL